MAYIICVSFNIIVMLLFKGLFMISVIKDVRGISNIMGALMLILIVMTAATSLALFTAQTQEIRQEAELAELQQELEKIAILGMQNPEYSSTTEKLGSVSFIIANTHSDLSVITRLSVNNFLIYNFIFERQDGTIEEWKLSAQQGGYKLGGNITNDGSSEPYVFSDKDADGKYSSGDVITKIDYDENGIDANPTLGDSGYILGLDNSQQPYIFHDKNGNRIYDAGTENPPIDKDPDGDGIDAIEADGDEGDLVFTDFYIRPAIFAREQIILNINDAANDIINGEDIEKNDALKLMISTNLINEFEKTFYPPTSIIHLVTESQWNPNSGPSGAYENFLILDGSLSDHSGDGYIVKWEWTVENSAPTSTTVFGRKVVSPYNSAVRVDLEVTDNYGMKGSSSLVLN